MFRTVKALWLALGLAPALLVGACGAETEEIGSSALSLQAQSTQAQSRQEHPAHAPAPDPVHSSEHRPAQSPAAATAPTAEPIETVNSQLALDVYKSETCGCCKDWVEHMAQHDFGITVHHPLDLAAQKEALGVAPQYQSCHTAVNPAGYVFEGHVPAKLVDRFLEEKPAGAIGLAVPGMPVGSPGMEVGDNFMPYAVLLLLEDGSSRVYEQIHSPQDQY